jgi:hypothetical protein
MPIVRESEVLAKMPDHGALSSVRREELIQAVIEKASFEGKVAVNFGKTVYCRGVHPNREWSNFMSDFEETPEEKAKNLEAKRAAEAKLKREEDLADENEILKAKIRAFEEAEKKKTPKVPAA